jgi:3-dehydroquinate synthetase
VLAAEVDAQLARVKVPPLPQFDSAAVLDAVGRDKKKAAGGATRFVLLRDIGETIDDAGVDRRAMSEAIAFLETACAAPS